MSTQYAPQPSAPVASPSAPPAAAPIPPQPSAPLPGSQFVQPPNPNDQNQQPVPPSDPSPNLSPDVNSVTSPAPSVMNTKLVMDRVQNYFTQNKLEIENNPKMTELFDLAYTALENSVKQEKQNHKYMKIEEAQQKHTQQQVNSLISNIIQADPGMSNETKEELQTVQKFPDTMTISDLAKFPNIAGYFHLKRMAQNNPSSSSSSSYTPSVTYASPAYNSVNIPAVQSTLQTVQNLKNKVDHLVQTSQTLYENQYVPPPQQQQAPVYAPQQPQLPPQVPQYTQPQQPVYQPPMQPPQQYAPPPPAAQANTGVKRKYDFNLNDLTKEYGRIPDIRAPVTQRPLQL